jgi:hypothetical protein
VAASFKPIRPLLQTGGNAGSRWFSYIGLGIGVLLLLCAIQMFMNIQLLLGDNNNPRKGTSDFISISKTITNETMGQLDKNLFHADEINALAAQPFIEGVSPLLSNRFQVQLSAGEVLPFSTDLFMESVDDAFIDTVPPNFSWQQGQVTIPIIFSADFLEMYNVFAPGYGLPQISEATAARLSIFITCSGSNGQQQTFRGNIVAFSDRINSIIVPKNFLTWANNTFGHTNDVKASRLFIKTKDANNPAFLDYLQQKQYKVNKDKTKFGRVKQVLQGIVSGLGIFGLLVVVLALLLFSFYLQLMIARSKDSLHLLLQLGYSPNWLSKKVAQQFVPVYVSVVLIALGVTAGLQGVFQQLVMNNRAELLPWLHWAVIATALLLTGLSLLTNYRMVKRLLYKLA